jgi:hypothetical protein
MPRHRRSGFVDGRGSRRGAGRTPRAGVAAPAASGSRPCGHQRGGRARRWQSPPEWWPGRRRAALRTAPAALRSAGSGPGRARSPLEQSIELVFEIESGILLTAVPGPDGTLGHIGGTEPQHPRVSSGSSRRLIGLVAGRVRPRAAGRGTGRLALLRQRSAFGGRPHACLAWRRTARLAATSQDDVGDGLPPDPAPAIRAHPSISRGDVGHHDQ